MSDENRDYDGIRYKSPDKQPLPFRILHYSLAVWGVLFMAYFLLSGWSSEAEYAEIKKAKETRLAAAKEKQAETGPVPAHEENRTKRLMDEGKKEYEARCVACHGPDGKGGIGPDLTAKSYKYGKTAPEVTKSVAEGRPGGMPGFGKELSQEKLEGVVQYVISFQK